MASPPSAEETYEHGQSAKLLQRSETSVGWISRKQPRLRSRQNFFLDIPFYRTHYTLCPLGEPEIAIGHEPRIEPWLTLSTRLACRSLEPDGIATIRGGNL